MKKNLRILLAVVILMATSAMISYAAFPVSSQGSNTTALIDNYRASSNETVAKQADEPVSKTASMPAKSGGHHSGKSQIVAAVLCFFLGGLGIHRFYLGYTWQGIVQLLTGGGCGIWALIDFIRILMGTLGPKDGKYDQTF